MAVEAMVSSSTFSQFWECRQRSGDKSKRGSFQGSRKMAKPQLAMDALFWDLNLASPRNIDGSSRSVPGESFPMDGARTSRALRIEQLSFLGQGFPLGLIPSLCPVPSRKDLGSLAFQCVPVRISVGDWWIGLVGQFRPKKLISNIKSQLPANNNWDLSTFQNLAKSALDKTIYASGLFSEIPVTDRSSLIFSSEAHNERKGNTNKLVYYHKLPEHDVSLEAAWPDLFLDNKGRYWNVPESISLDLASLDFGSGFRYRLGIHKNSGHPQAVNPTVADVPPPSLMPGLCTKAAFSYEKSKDFWREKETRDDVVIKTDQGTIRQLAYDERLKEPHSTVSAIAGGTCGAWFWGNKNPKTQTRIRSPVFADLFGSLCYTFQQGKFRKPYRDLTRVDARLDVCSATAFAKSMLSIFSSSSNQESCPSSPRFSMILQQQVAGPIVFRVDTKCALRAPWNGFVKVEDFMYSLNYSLRALGSGKVVAWYSPKRKEGMIELRLYEF